MLSIQNYKYDNNVISNIKNWGYGENWPSVYIFYNDKKAYVGESLDVKRRTEQHLQETEFKDFTDLCLISNSTYNKSVILDLESFLIKYLSADEQRVLLNGNSGVSDHNYFYKEAYYEEFVNVWDKLKELSIVSKGIEEIENSELFKYSPFKALNDEQKHSTFEILDALASIKSPDARKMIQVVGGAGTGKTILAVYLIKLIVDIKNKDEWKYINDDENFVYIKRISSKISHLKKIGFVVPMSELNQTMKKVFDSIDGLSSEMIVTAAEVTEAVKKYDLLVVDEAHRLYKRTNLPNDGTAKFDRINRRLMGNDFSENPDIALTELDWIIKSSKTQIIFYDKFQSIRQSDIGYDRFEKICSQVRCDTLELKSQMRCKGGNGYYEYIKDILEEKSFPIHKIKKISGYEFAVVDTVNELVEVIKEKDKEFGLSLVMTGPSFSSEGFVEIDGNKFEWDKAGRGKRIVKKQKDGKLWSIHKVQGFDLNFGGVIFGDDVYYDEVDECVKANRQKVKDNNAKPKGDDAAMNRNVLNIYLTLMTRGIRGTYVYASDEKLRNYLKKFINV